jgi:alkanesulfonate monooxygenase SsuD/methylene tetrahydromethanopterin reductase-like flavin-dependent oxidoreductase (luciferase family)
MVAPPFAAPSKVGSKRDVLLATKLHVPRLRPDLVPHPRLAERLDEGLARRLMLVCAPAGYGKTVLAWRPTVPARSIAGTPARVASQLTPYAEAGADVIIVVCDPALSPRSWELLADVRLLLTP